MKKLGIAAALVLSSVFATAAMARPVDLYACTKDGQTASLHVDVAGVVQKPASSTRLPLETILADAFTKTANSLTADDLTGQKGAEVLDSNLHNELKKMTFVSKDAELVLSGPPVITDPVCTRKELEK